jgi:hypothetical protein
MTCAYRQAEALDKPASLPTHFVFTRSKGVPSAFGRKRQAYLINDDEKIDPPTDSTSRLYAERATGYCSTLIFSLLFS